jgi:hypothetical protein
VDKARHAWDALVTEQAGLPDLLADAIAESDAPRIDHIKQRQRAVDTEIVLAELAFQKARLHVLYASKARTIQTRDRLRDEASRLGRDSGYPEGKDAGEAAYRAYWEARDVTNGSEIPRVTGRIGYLTGQLANG